MASHTRYRRKPAAKPSPAKWPPRSRNAAIGALPAATTRAGRRFLVGFDFFGDPFPTAFTALVLQAFAAPVRVDVLQPATCGRRAPRARPEIGDLRSFAIDVVSHLPRTSL